MFYDERAMTIFDEVLSKIEDRCRIWKSKVLTRIARLYSFVDDEGHIG